MPELYSDKHTAFADSGKKQCMGCMEFYDAEFDVCPYCGYEENQSTRELLHIEPGSLLAGRYIIGQTLGSGSFGVTYIGWDTQLKRKVAVKEYFPSEFATRMIHHQELMLGGNEKKRQQFADGMKKFLQEGKKLAQVSNIDGIVYMYDSFEANNTAYIVMEYLEGETLESFLAHEGILSEQQALEFIIPVLQALEVVHEKGIIHRDIAPDNIFLALEGDGKLKVKLIDFGAARFATTSHSKSLTVLIKPGYSPEEQYRSDGTQGPYTDVYAIASVLYRMVTGKQPPDALERRGAISMNRKDILEEPGKYNKDLSANFEIALLNAMNVRIEDRTATVADFMDELVSYEPVKRRGNSIRRIDFMRWPVWAKIGVPVASAAAIALLVFVGWIVFSDPSSVYTLPDGMVRVPDLVTTDFSRVQEEAEDRNLIITSSGSQYSPNAAADLVLLQDISAGTVTYENTEVNVVISTGQENYVLPDVTGMTIADARYALECMGLEVLTEEGKQDGLAGGSVIIQSIEPYSKINYGETITLTVTEDEKAGTGKKAPSLTGLTYEEALKAAADAKVNIVITDKIFSKEYSDTEVISQNIKSGKSIKNGTYIEIAVALKWREFAMPNLMYKDKDTAKQLLKNIGVEAEISEEISEVVSNGLVFDQNIDKETAVQPGEKAALSVSKGSKPFSMPKVEGMTEKEACKILADSKLAVSVEYGYKKNVKEGSVISQSIADRKDVTRGTAVTIKVCSMDGLVTVADISGLTQEAAVKKLKEQGLKTKVEENYSQSVKKGVVIGQLPKAGSVQKEDTVIVLTVSKGKKTVETDSSASAGNTAGSSKAETKPAETTKAVKETTKAAKETTAAKKETSAAKSWTWSEWSTAVPSGTSEYEKKTQYRSRTLETKTSSNSTMSGWTLYDATYSWGDYGSWSDWSTTAVSSSDSTKVEKKTQSRYQDKETTTSTSSSLSGWTQTGSSVSYGSWGSWSDWQTGSVSSSDTRDVESATIYGYYYYQCPKCGAHMHVYTACYTWAGGCGNTTSFKNTWHAMWTTTSWSNSGSYEFHGTGKYATDSLGGGRWFQWNDNGTPRTGYRYRDRSKTTYYSYERWGSWSSWSDSSYSSSGTRNVETRTVYRYCTRSQKATYHFKRWSDWSAYGDTPISESSNVEVQKRTVYRYKIYN